MNNAQHSTASSKGWKRRADMWLLVSAIVVVMMTGGWFAVAWSRSTELHLVGDSFGPLTALFSGLGLVAIGFALVHEGRVALEQKLGEEYRTLLKLLPVQSLLSPASPCHTARSLDDSGRGLSDEHLRLAFCYFDLSNTQAYFYQCGQVREATWVAWRDGIRDNMMRGWFAFAWKRICQERAESIVMSQHLRFLHEEVVATSAELKLIYSAGHDPNSDIQAGAERIGREDNARHRPND